jgi:hypothetical protein
VYSFVANGLQLYVSEQIIQSLFNEDLIGEAIAVATSSLEQDWGFMLSPVEFRQSVDYFESMGTRNQYPILLTHRPAFKVLSVRFAYGHTHDEKPLGEILIPPSWITLEKNKMNIIPSRGYLSTYSQGSGGWWNYLQNQSGTINSYGGYPFAQTMQQKRIEVHYVAGFDPDKLPANLSMAIKLKAGITVIQDALPLMFPSGSVSVSIDGVSQSAQNNIYAQMMGRVQQMEARLAAIKSEITKSHGASIKIRVINS